MKVTVLKDKEPKVFITKNALDKIETFCAECDKEIGWLATACKSKQNYVIKDCFLFKQEVASTTCELTEEGLNDFAQEIIKTEKGVEIWNEIKCWGHSHVNMNVLPSGQDEKQFENLAKNQDDFFIRIIANKKNKISISIIDFEEGLRYDELDYTVMFDLETNNRIKQLKEIINNCKKELEQKLSTPESLKKQIKEEIKEKVKPLVYKTYGYNNKNNIYAKNTKEDWKKYYKTDKNEVVIIDEEEGREAEEIFDELTIEQIFDMYEQCEAGIPLKTLIGEKISDDELIYFNQLLEDYIIINWCAYAEYEYSQGKEIM